jgi:hypothetical protein
MGRPPQRKRMPVVLMVQEVQSLLSRMAGTEALLAVLLDGSGLRMREALGWRACRGCWCVAPGGRAWRQPGVHGQIEVVEPGGRQRGVVSRAAA